MKGAMKTLTLTIDHLPPRDLNPNRARSIHWTKRSRVERSAREEAYWTAKAGCLWKQPLEKARISYVFNLKDHRNRDLDNLIAASKPFTDGLVDAGVIGHDDIEHLEYGSIRAVVTGTEATVIIVEEI